MPTRSLVERIPPLWLGIGISGSLIAALMVSETLLGRWPELLVEGEFDALAQVSTGVLRDARIALVHCLVIGYLPAALLHVMRSGRRTVLVLQGVLACTRDECTRLAASVRLSARGFVLTGLLGLLLSLLPPYIVPPVPPAPWNPSAWTPEVVWHRVLGPAAMVLTGWLLYAVVTVSVRMSRTAKKLNRIDLFDQSALLPFTQQGLMNALLLIGSVSIWSLMLIETGMGLILLLLGGVTLATAVIALLWPVQGVHRRILQAKQAELGWVNAELSRLRSGLRGPDGKEAPGELADLIAYRGLVENVAEWPFTTSTYTRLVLYTLLPALTWGLGQVAEEVLGRFFF